MSFDFNIPTEVGDDLANRIEQALDEIAEVTVENRIYALNEEDLPDGETIKYDRADLPYYVDGEQKLFSEAGVSVDKEEDDVWIAVQSEIRMSHWKERGHDYAGKAYDVMEEYGIERPEGDELKYRNAGVKFGTLPEGTRGAGPQGDPHPDLKNAHDVAAVENVVIGGAE